MHERFTLHNGISHGSAVKLNTQKGIKEMKKITALLLCTLMIMSCFGVIAAEEKKDPVYFNVLNIAENSKFIDNPDTNVDAAGYALCYAEKYGTGRTTQGDVVAFENVALEKKVIAVAIRCGYGPKADGSGTRFDLYNGETKLGEFPVSAEMTQSSQIIHQVYVVRKMEIPAGTYTFNVKAETAFSGSFSQVVFIYEDAPEAALLADGAYRTLVVKEGLCELIDNPATNDQAAKHALCFAEKYGTGRTTQGDIVKFADIDFGRSGVTEISVKCGYNLGGDKKGTGTEFWVYIDDEKCEGEPVGKFAVNDSETASSQIIHQIYKTVKFDKELTGVHDIYVKGETENSGSFSQVVFKHNEVPAKAEEQVEVGKKINEVLNTDIVCLIDGKPIASYNIEGNTAIVAEDLANYGFKVEWFGSSRRLSVTKGDGVVTATGEIAKNENPVGSYAMDVFATDILTYVNYKRVNGYNVGGSTIIFIDDLAAFGELAWDADARTIAFTFKK